MRPACVVALLHMQPKKKNALSIIWKYLNRFHQHADNNSNNNNKATNWWRRGEKWNSHDNILLSFTMIIVIGTVIVINLLCNFRTYYSLHRTTICTLSTGFNQNLCYARNHFFATIISIRNIRNANNERIETDVWKSSFSRSSHKSCKHIRHKRQSACNSFLYSCYSRFANLIPSANIWVD